MQCSVVLCGVVCSVTNTCVLVCGQFSCSICDTRDTHLVRRLAHSGRSIRPYNSHIVQSEKRHIILGGATSSVHCTHCTLWTCCKNKTHCTLHTAHKLHTPHYTHHTKHCTLHTLHTAVHTAHCSPHHTVDESRADTLAQKCERGKTLSPF